MGGLSMRDGRCDMERRGNVDLLIAWRNEGRWRPIAYVSAPESATRIYSASAPGSALTAANLFPFRWASLRCWAARVDGMGYRAVLVLLAFWRPLPFPLPSPSIMFSRTLKASKSALRVRRTFPVLISADPVSQTANRQQQRNLSIHEYQSVQLLNSYGIPTPTSKPAFSAAEAEQVAKTFSGSRGRTC